MTDHEVLTAKEVADLFRTTSQAVKQMAIRGDLAYFRAGREYRFLRSTVAEYMQGPAKPKRVKTY